MIVIVAKVDNVFDTVLQQVRKEDLAVEPVLIVYKDVR